MGNVSPQQFEEDIELIRSAKLRDRWAFERLAGRYRRMVLGIACGRVEERDAEDLAQEVMLRVWEKLPSLKDPRAFPAWLSRVTINACREWRGRSSHRTLPLLDDFQYPAERAEDPLDHFLRLQQSLELREALFAIPEENRKALIMHIWGHYAYSEISDRLGVPLPTVVGRIHRARKQLRKLMGDPEPAKSARAVPKGAERMVQTVGEGLAELIPQLGHTGTVRTLSVCPNGTRFASSDNAGITVVWNLDTGMQEIRVTNLLEVIAVSFTSDGRRVAMSSWSGDTVIYDVEQGAPLMTLPIRPSLLQFDQDGSHLWTVSWAPDPGDKDKLLTNVFCWSLETRQIVRRIEGLQGGPSALSRDLSRVVTTAGERMIERRHLHGMRDVRLHVWDLATGEEVSRLDGLNAHPSEFAVSADGRLVASAEWSQKTTCDVFVWDSETGKLLYRLPGHEETVGALGFSPDGKTLGTGDLAGDIICWDLSTGRPISRMKNQGRIDALVFTSDGGRIITSDPDQTANAFDYGGIGIWDWRNERVRASLVQHTNSVNAAAFTPDGRRLITGGESFRTAVWDLKAGEIAGCPQQNERSFTTSLSVHPQGTELILSTVRYDGGEWGRGAVTQLRLWDLEKMELKSVVAEFPGYTGSVAYSRDGRRVTVGKHAAIPVLDSQTWQPEREISYPENWAAMATQDFSPDGRLFLAVGVNLSSDHTTVGGEITLWDLDTGEAARRWWETRGFQTAALSPDGRMAAGGMLFPPTYEEPYFRVLLHDVESGKQVHEFALADEEIGRVLKLTFSRDSRYLFAASVTGLVTVWNTTTGQLVRSVRRHSTMTHAITVSPDGQFLVLGGRDGTIIFWRIDDLLRGEDPRETLTLVSIDNGSDWLAYTPDGHYDCSAGAEKYLLWREASRFLTTGETRERCRRPGLITQALRKA